MADCKILDLSILVAADNGINPAEVGAHVPCHADDVHLGGVLVLAAVHLLGVNLKLLHVRHHLLSFIGIESDAEGREGVSHNLAKYQMDNCWITDLFTWTKYFLSYSQLPRNSIVAKVDV